MPDGFRSLLPLGEKAHGFLIKKRLAFRGDRGET
jgi:hypothetical protein